jgi:hypothetical protein
MRLWSIHPKYLDAKGLVALWREGLLAVLASAGKTRGYKNHPQLDRFYASSASNSVDTECIIASYLLDVQLEASSRGYTFNLTALYSKATPQACERITVTRGQLIYEWEHLLLKLCRRDHAKYLELRKLAHHEIECHDMFVIIDGPVEAWEKVK